MRQQLVEDYIGFKSWYMDGDDLPWIKADTVSGHEAYAGTIITAVSAGDWDADQRTNTAVEALAAAKKVIIKPKQGWVGIGFRFRYNGIDGDQHVLQLFAGFGPDHYQHVAQLTIDQGTQEYSAGAAGTGIKFCDVITPANEAWFTVPAEGTTTNFIGTYSLNTHGADRWWIVASTLDVANAGTTLYVDFKQL